MKLKKHFLTLLLSTSTFVCFSQESEIVISEDHLISLIQKIKDKRAANQLQYNTTQALLSKNNTAKNVNTEKVVTVGQKPDLNAAKLDSLSKKMNGLEQELKYLNSLLVSNQQAARKQSPVPYDYTEKNETTTTQPEFATVPTDNAALIVSLQQQLDSLKRTARNREVVKVALAPVAIAPVTTTVAQPNLVKVIRDTIVVKNEPSDYLVLEAKYKGYIKKVFFDNNSKEINQDQTAALDQVIDAMLEAGSIDVFLKGFASKKGSAAYNQNLSFLRTESVKRYLIAKGIHPSRILSQFHGIDYEATEADSRRVDATFIIRK